MPIKGVATTVQYVAWDTAANTGKAGDAANHTIRGVGDGAEFTPAAAPAQVDATNLPGVYKIALASGEMAYDVVTVGGKSSTAGVVLIPLTIVTTPAPATIAAACAAAILVTPANKLATDAAGEVQVDYSQALPVTPTPGTTGSAFFDVSQALTADEIATAVLTTAMTESYNIDGAAPTLAQALFVTMQRLTDFAIVGTALTVRRLDGVATAYGLTLDSATAPTSSTRTS